MGLFSTWDGSVAWDTGSPQLSDPPAGSQSRNNGRNELRWEEPKNRRREGIGEPGLKIIQTQNQVTQKGKTQIMQGGEGKEFSRTGRVCGRDRQGTKPYKMDQSFWIA